jgi:hypothetical protein
MKTELLNEVADAIEYADRFCLRTWASKADNIMHRVKPVELWESCDTVGCVAGWTNAVIEAPRSPSIDNQKAAREALGLTFDQARELFIPPAWEGNSVWGKDPYKANARRAAKVLREIASGKRTFDCDRSAGKR